MKRARHTINKLRITIIAVIAVIGLTTVGTLVHAASGGQIYLAPSSGTYTVGQDVAIAVRENGNGAAVNSTQVGINYPANLLQFTSIDGTGSAFTTDLSPGTQNSGEVVITRISASSSFATDELIATIHFTALAAGTAPLTFTTSCQSSTAADCTGLGAAGSTIGTTTTGGSYTLQAPVTTTPPPVTTTPPPTTTTPPPATTSTNAGASTTKSTSTSITPQASSTSITAPTGSSVQVSTPATVEPATIQPDGVQKIQYYLNSKLVYTATDVPFAYHLDTTSLLNGTYTLKTVSYYDSGRTTTSSQKLIVSNPFSFTQFRLLIAHYAWEIIIILSIILLILLAWLTRRRWHNFGSPRFGSSASSTPPNIQTPPSIVTPSGSNVSVLTPQAIPIRSDEG